MPEIIKFDHFRHDIIQSFFKKLFFRNITLNYVNISKHVYL